MISLISFERLENDHIYRQYGTAKRYASGLKIPTPQQAIQPTRSDPSHASDAVHNAQGNDVVARRPFPLAGQHLSLIE